VLEFVTILLLESVNTLTIKSGHILYREVVDDKAVIRYVTR
jgi:hypothetical protein